jgi:hypothetical protein
MLRQLPAALRHAAPALSERAARIHTPRTAAAAGRGATQDGAKTSEKARRAACSRQRSAAGSRALGSSAPRGSARGPPTACRHQLHHTRLTGAPAARLHVVSSSAAGCRVKRAAAWSWHMTLLGSPQQDDAVGPHLACRPACSRRRHWRRTTAGAQYRVGLRLGPDAHELDAERRAMHQHPGRWELHDGSQPARASHAHAAGTMRDGHGRARLSLRRPIFCARTRAGASERGRVAASLGSRRAVPSSSIHAAVSGSAPGGKDACFVCSSVPGAGSGAAAVAAGRRATQECGATHARPSRHRRTPRAAAVSLSGASARRHWRPACCKCEARCVLLLLPLMALRRRLKCSPDPSRAVRMPPHGRTLAACRAKKGGSGNGRGRGLYACDSRAVPEAAHSQEDWLEDEGAPRGRRWRWPRRGAWSGLSKRLSVRKERCVLHRPGPEACRSRRTRGLPVLCSLLHSAPPALRGRSSARQAASASAQTAGSTCVSSAAACARPRAS